MIIAKVGQRWRYTEGTRFDFIIEVISPAQNSNIVVQSFSGPIKTGEEYYEEITECNNSSYILTYLPGQDAPIK
jgi:hypothetical protein